MLESPLIDELVMEKYGDLLTEKTREIACETAQRAIVTVLEARFGDLSRDLVEEIESVDRDEQLQALMRMAGTCPDLEAFRSTLSRN